MQRKIIVDLIELNYSENVDEKAMQQWINEYSKLKVLSDDGIVSRIACGSEETRRFDKRRESDEENLVTHPKIRNGEALDNIEALLNAVLGCSAQQAENILTHLQVHLF